MRKRVTVLAAGLLASALAVALALAAGCSDGDNGEKPTATPQRATASPAVTPSPLPDLRTLDLSTQPEVRDLAERLGGQVSAEEVIYADLTGDGRDDAVVPISSGGTQGDLGFIVLGYVGGELKALLTEAPREGGVRVAVSGGSLVESLPVYAGGDLPGFPSKIKSVYYAWKDGSLVVDHEEVIDNPSLPRRP
ncbi:MAG TPA: hypothetical protein VM013_03470 [Dehalococcoidia bacterium]|nr:hypothetical protein [Dehalococcoidia bacterium]